jgi:hypothetical protein
MPEEKGDEEEIYPSIPHALNFYRIDSNIITAAIKHTRIAPTRKKPVNIKGRSAMAMCNIPKIIDITYAIAKPNTASKKYLMNLNANLNKGLY